MVFRENFHMDIYQFDHIFKLVEVHLLPKKNTRPNDGINPKEKLAMVLEYVISLSTFVVNVI